MYAMRNKDNSFLFQTVKKETIIITLTIFKCNKIRYSIFLIIYLPFICTTSFGDFKLVNNKLVYVGRGSSIETPISMSFKVLNRSKRY